MSIVLYKAGNTSKIRGIPCEVLICDEYSYLHNLEDGWKYSPEECYAEAEEEEIVEEAPEDVDQEEAEPEEAEPVLVLEDEAAEEETEALMADEIRSMAKDAGIGNWHNKKIENLLKELEALTDGE